MMDIQSLRYVISVTPVGSRVSCSPPPTDTDEDFLVLVKAATLDCVIDDLISRNCELGGSRVRNKSREGLAPDAEEDGFVSMRKGNHNYLLTECIKFHGDFMLATHVCTRLNLLGKEHRILVFQAILYGALK